MFTGNGRGAEVKILIKCVVGYGIFLGICYLLGLTGIFKGLSYEGFILGIVIIGGAIWAAATYSHEDGMIVLNRKPAHTIPSTIP